jgi:solute carrier family 25 protein 16
VRDYIYALCFNDNTYDVGTFSVFLTYPLELIRVRMAYQTQTASRHALLDAIRAIYVEGNGPPPSTGPGAAQRSSPLFITFPVSKFYRGFSVTLLGMVPYAGTSFLAWGALRAALIPPPQSQTEPPRHRPVADLSIGALSGAIAQTVSYPFEVVRRRLQVGGLIRPRGFVGWGETVRGIWAAQGWRGFFVGLSIGYVKVVPMTAVSFMCWETGKRLLGV